LSVRDEHDACVAVETDLLSILGLCFDFHLVETFSRRGIISAPGFTLFSEFFGASSPLFAIKKLDWTENMHHAAPR